MVRIVRSVSWGVIEEEGLEFMMVEVLLTIVMVWLGTKGGSLTCSKTNDEDEAKVVPIWVGTSFTTCSMIICSGSVMSKTASVPFYQSSKNRVCFQQRVVQFDWFLRDD